MKNIFAYLFRGDIRKILLISFVTFLGYVRGINNFFEQDDWSGLGRFNLLRESGFITTILSFFTPSRAHYVPLQDITFYILASLFSLNYLGYVIFSIICHVVITCLVYFLGKAVFKTSYLALFTAILFGTNAVIFQTTTWAIPAINTLSAVIFGLISLILLSIFIENKKNRFFYWSLPPLLISLFFKEVTMGLFVFIPLVILKLVHTKRRYFYSGIVIATIVAYIAIRALMFFAPFDPIKGTTLVATQSQSITDISYNIFSFPAKIVSQSMIPVSQQINTIYFLIARSHKLTTYINDSLRSDILKEKVVLESLAFIIFFGILFLLFFLKKFKNNNEYFNKSLLALTFIVLNSFIYALSPGRSGVISVIDSRNLYFPAIGTSFLIVLLSRYILGDSKIKIGAVFLILMVLNLYVLNKNIDSLINVGQERKAILELMKQYKPQLPKKAIIYTQSDTSYYGLSEDYKIMPFQSGFGQTLLVWYQDQSHFPKEFFENRFLWNLTDQGYKEVGDRGFGYFREFNLLASTIKEENLDPESIIAFGYNSKTKILRDITDETKGRISGYLSDQKPISLRGVLVTSSENSQDSPLAIDQNRETQWTSKVPYKTYQDFLITLVDRKKIAKLRIDSYNDLDQIAVGYSLLLSLDGVNWHEVFNNKKYIPNKEGYVDIYIRPQDARFIKLIQLGNHLSAPWVINEVTIYEVIN